MATADDALACCQQTQQLLQEFQNTLTNLLARIAALENTQAGKDPRVDQMYQLLLPILSAKLGNSEIQSWLFAEIAKDPEIQIAVGLALNSVLRQGGLPVRDSFVSILIDSLGRVFLGWIQSAWVSFSAPVEFPIDRVFGTEEELMEKPEDTVTGDLSDRFKTITTDIENAATLLDGGNDPDTGGTLAAKIVFNTVGLYLSDIIAEVTTQFIRNLTTTLFDERVEEEEPLFSEWQHNFQRLVTTVPGYTADEFANLTKDLGGVIIPETTTPPAKGGTPGGQPATPPESAGTPTGS